MCMPCWTEKMLNFPLHDNSLAVIEESKLYCLVVHCVYCVLRMWKLSTNVLCDEDLSHFSAVWFSACPVVHIKEIILTYLSDYARMHER